MLNFYEVMDKNKVDESVDELLAEDGIASAINSSSGIAASTSPDSGHIATRPAVEVMSRKIDNQARATLPQHVAAAQTEQKADDAASNSGVVTNDVKPAKAKTKWMIIAALVFLAGLGSFILRDYLARQQAAEKTWQIEVLQKENQKLFEQTLELKKQL